MTSRDVDNIPRWGGALYDRSIADTDRSPRADDIFDAWHATAAAYVRALSANDDPEARGTAQARAELILASRLAIRNLSGSVRPGSTASRDATTFLLRAALGHCRKILELCVGKQKIRSAIEHRDAEGPGRSPVDSRLAEAVRGAFEEWTSSPRGAAHPDPGVLAERLAAATEAVRFAVAFGNRCAAGEEILPGAAIETALGNAVRAAVGVNGDETVRGAAAELVPAIADLGPGWCAKALAAAVRGAGDHAGLARVWSWGGLEDRDALEVVESRASRDDAMAREVLSSLVDALLDERRSVDPGRPRRSLSSGSAGGGARASSPSLVGAAQAAQAAGAELSPQPGRGSVLGAGSISESPAALAGALRLLRVCDAAARSEHKEEDERDGESLRVAGMLLALRPGDREIFELIVTEPVTVESVALLAAHASHIPQEAWVSHVIPWAHRRIDAMGVEGVSGDRVEQEVIDLVRDAAREFYIDGREVPLDTLGRVVLAAMFNAIRHGYVETERFPQLCAAVIARHVAAAGDAAAVSWLAPLLDSRLCRGRRTQRAVSEVLCAAAAVEGPVEARAGDAPVDPVAAEAVMRAAVDALGPPTSSPAAARFVVETYRACPADASTSRPAAAAARRRALDAPLLRRVVAAVNAAVLAITRRSLPGSVARELAPQLLGVVHAVSARAPAEHAPALFDATLRVVTFALPAASFAGDAAFGSVLGAGVSVDECIATITERIPHPFMVPPHALAAAMRSGSMMTRQALARVAPHVCLTDPDPAVREPALSALAGPRSDLLPSCWQLVVAASLPAPKREVDAATRSELDLIRAAASALASVAVTHAPSLPSAAARLLRGVRLSAKQSLTGLPETEIVSAAEHVAVHGDREHCLAFLVSEQGRRLGARCITGNEHLPRWRALLATLEAHQIVVARGEGKGGLALGPGAGQRGGDQRSLPDRGGGRGGGSGGGSDEWTDLAASPAFAQPLLERLDGDPSVAATGAARSATGDIVDALNIVRGSSAAATTDAGAFADSAESLARDGRMIEALRAARDARAANPDVYEKRVAALVAETIVPAIAADPDLSREDLVAAQLASPLGADPRGRISEALRGRDVAHVRRLARDSGRVAAFAWVRQVNPPHAALLHDAISGIQVDHDGQPLFSFSYEPAGDRQNVDNASGEWIVLSNAVQDAKS